MVSEPDTQRSSADLEKESERRIGILRSQGVVVQGLEGHYVTVLLEELLGDRLEEAKRKHGLWVLGQLDEIESQVRQSRLTAGVGGAIPAQSTLIQKP